MQIVMDELPIGALFTWKGTEYKKIVASGCCANNSNTPTCWILETDRPAYLNPGELVEPMLFSLENVKEIPENCKELPNFNQLCHHLVIHSDDAPRVLEAIVSLYGDREFHLTDIWQIYLFKDYDENDYTYIDKACKTTSLSHDGLKNFITANLPVKKAKNDDVDKEQTS